MSRTPIPVDKIRLSAILNECDSQGLENRSRLYQKVADTYNGEYEKKISPALVYLRVRDWKLQLNTPVGKRGRQPGQGGGGGKVSRSVKFANNPQIKASLCQIKGVTPERFQPVANRVVNGSMKAAVNLKCLDCCDYQTIEIKLCKCQECSLWPFRPYQKG